MKISELMAELETAMKLEGDIDVIIDTYEHHKGVSKTVDAVDCLPEGCYKGYGKAVFVIETGKTVGTYR